jgi:hypothetical protein
MEAKRKESNVMTPVELFLSVVAVLAHALALTAVAVLLGFLVLLIWNRLMPLVVRSFHGFLESKDLIASHRRRHP